MSIKWQIENIGTLPSTMDAVHVQALNGAAEGLVVSAVEQTKGRGRRGNEWIAPPGNLYCSILLRPQTDLKDIGQYSFIASVALGETVKKHLKDSVKFNNKWPNDCLIDGRKFAGILLEGGAGYLVIGMGVNIVSAPEDKATLNDNFNVSATAGGFLGQYLESLDQLLDLHKKAGFKPIRELWLEDAKGLKEEITVRLPNETLEGIFNGLDENGGLLLGLANGMEKVIHSGEVFFRKDM